MGIQVEYRLLVYISSACRVRWLAGSEVDSKYFSLPNGWWDKIAR